MSGALLAPVGARRRQTDRAARAALVALTGLALVPLALLLAFVVQRGAGAWSLEFFTTDPTGSFLGDPGGIRSAILGTVVMVGLATAVAVPVGIGVALYLVEVGRGRCAAIVRYLVDVLTGVPSIVFGLFVYTSLVATGWLESGYAAWKGSLALALLMLPVVTRAAEVVLRLVPGALREAALALGAPRWAVAVRIVLPSARPGLVTGSLLAVARAAGETAPLLFTAQLTLGTTFDLNARMNALPSQIFADVGQAQDRLVERAWGAALTLVALVLIVTVTARLVSRKRAD